MAILSQQEYQKLPNETIDQYNARIAPSYTPDSITSNSLTPTTPTNYTNPNASYYSPASSVDASVQNTATQPAPIESEISSLIKSINDLNSENTGKTAFTQEQEQTQGLQAAKDVQNSLSKRILALQANEKAIPLQLQEQATGRGITTGGLAPIQTGALRENAINATILGAQLDAAKFDVASAQDKVNAAVTAKFGPKEEEIKAKLANLELKLKDPNLTIAEKNRANAQALLLKEQEQKDAQKKEDYNNAQKNSIEAHANINNFKPTTNYPDVQTALKAIEDAAKKGDINTVLKITSETGLSKPQAAQSDFEQAFQRTYGRLPNLQELQNYEAGKKINNNPLSSTEIQQAQIDYPDAGIKFGDTQATANAKIQALNKSVNPNSVLPVENIQAPTSTTNFSGTTFNGLIATLPNGSKLNFPTQQALDQFKKDHSLTESSKFSYQAPDIGGLISKLFGK